MSRRIDSIQSLRAIAFLAVFMSHSRLFGLGFLGAWGVSIFFVLSGFLMVYSYYPKIVMHFHQRIDLHGKKLENCTRYIF